MDFMAKVLSAGFDPWCSLVLVCLLYFKVTPLRWVFLLLVSVEFDGPSVDTNNHSHQRCQDRQPSLETVLDSNTKLEAAPCPDHRERKSGYTQNSAPPPTFRHRTVEYFQLEGNIRITKCSSQYHPELNHGILSTIQAAEIG